MKVPLSWLSGYCDPGWEPEHLAERLAMTGTEVERVGVAGAPSPEGFVVGLVTEVSAHPDADRLSVCRVETGDGERTIVCGAPNVAAGQLVPVALPGAVLPGGATLGRAKLRGVESDGMILSEAELEIGDDAAGIAVLGTEQAEADGLEPGRPLGELVAVSDRVLELEVTPNRPDCLSVYGVAREVHAVSGAELASPPWEQDVEAAGQGEASDYASVSVEVPDLCPRFTARVFTDVKPGPSPLWLKARLSAAGQRPINNVVDITNYVMLLIGQPLHAFDLDRVPDGALIVRAGGEGETMTTLDGIERELDPQTVVVGDRNGPSGIAGIMGGEVSEVSEQTTRVLLEVATWNGPNILRTSRRLVLRSEASARFEKGLHPALAMRAQRIASRLMVELCGARLVPGTIDVSVGEPEPRVVELRVPRVEQLVGMAIDVETCAARLEALGFGVRVEGEVIAATVPPERDGDVRREADLIEEVARLADLDRSLPTTLPGAAVAGGLPREQRLRRAVEDAIRDQGCDEVVGWSFVDPGAPARLRLPADDHRSMPIAISNPLSSDQSLMRTILLPGLLDVARRNRARGAERAWLFESGRTYERGGPESGERAHGIAEAGAPELAGIFRGHHASPALEPHRIGCVLSGAPPRGWRGEEGVADFYTAKGLLEALAARLGLALRFERAAEPFLHPGRSARVAIADGREQDAARLGELAGSFGWLGELHPLVAREWDLEGAAAFEVELAPLVAASPAEQEGYAEFTGFPPVHQDLAVVVDDETSFEQVREAVRAGAGELLESADVFDLYRGEQLGEGRKSLALRLSFRAPDRTLTDEEVAERRERIREALGGIGGSLRE